MLKSPTFIFVSAQRISPSDIIKLRENTSNNPKFFLDISKTWIAKHKQQTVAELVDKK